MEITVQAQKEAIRRALHYLSLLGVCPAEARVEAVFYGFTLEPDDEVQAFKQYRRQKSFERLRARGYFTEQFWAVNVMKPDWGNYHVNLTPEGRFMSFTRNICSITPEGFSEQDAQKKAVSVLEDLCGMKKVKLIQKTAYVLEGDQACCPDKKNQVCNFVFQDLSDAAWIQKSFLTVHVTVRDGLVTSLFRKVEISPYWRMFLYVLYGLLAGFTLLVIKWLFGGWRGTMYIPIYLPPLR